MLSIFVLICRISCFRHIDTCVDIESSITDISNQSTAENLATKLPFSAKYQDLELSIRGKPYIPYILCIDEALFWKYRQSYVP